MSARKFPTWKAGVPAYDHEEIIKLTALNIIIKRHDNCKWLAAVACFFVSIFLCDHNNLRQIFLTYDPWNPWGGGGAWMGFRGSVNQALKTYFLRFPSC